MNKHLLLLTRLLTLPAITALAHAETATYEIDPVHSGVLFKVQHFFTTVPGSFGQFGGTIHFDKEDVGNSRVEATIQTASIATHNEQRDGHLQSDDFFGAESHPTITFTSTSWDERGEDLYKVTGDLTMAGKTAPASLQVQFLGEGPGNQDSTISGWEITTTLERSKWGIDFAAGMIGDEVEVEIFIQAKKS